MSKSISFFAGIAAVAVYAALALVAFLEYPEPFGPLTNWLSDLGNPQVSPSGALFYNLGCALSSIVLAVFYVGLGTWNNGTRATKALLALGQVSGILSSVSLLLAGVFPLGQHTSVHSFWSAMLSVFLGFFLTFSATALLKQRSPVKWVGYYGFATAVVNFIYGAFLHSTFLAEWVSIGMFIVYVLLMASNSRLSAKAGRTQSLETVLRDGG